MRIAILTSPRSGSTSLFKLIEEHLAIENYISIPEPFNDYKPTKRKYSNFDYFQNENNIFIKTFIGNTQIPQFFDDNTDLYWDWFFDYFNKIILLDRIDKDLQSESLTFHMKKKYLLNWHQKQYYDLTHIKIEDIEKTKKTLITDSEKIHSVSNNGYPIFYYEDIYIKKDKNVIDEILKYIELDLNYELYEKYILSDRFKVRLEKNIKFI